MLASKGVAKHIAKRGDLRPANEALAADKQAAELLRALWAAVEEGLKLKKGHSLAFAEHGLTPAVLRQVDELVFLARLGHGLWFDGWNCSLAVPDGAEFRFKASLTLEAWIKPEPGGGPWQFWLFRGDDREKKDAWTFVRTGDTSVFLELAGPQGSARVGPGPLPVSRRVHIAGVLDAKTSKLRL